MNENMRDVTSKRPLTRVINVTRSQSCEMTTFSTGVSSLFIFHGIEKNYSIKKQKLELLKRQIKLI